MDTRTLESFDRILLHSLVIRSGLLARYVGPLVPTMAFVTVNAAYRTDIKLSGQRALRQLRQTP